MSFYITGDCHGQFEHLTVFCERFKTTKDDTMIILGDVGLNYFLGRRDYKRKKQVQTLPIRLFCIHGNHERRPHTVEGYIEGEFCGGKVLYEPQFPDILFAVDGEVYQFGEYRCLVAGGAYSVDKYYRLMNNAHWFPDEQPSPEIRQKVEEKIRELGDVDIMLTHTCPFRYMPAEAFLSGLDQSTVDNSTELWLDMIESNLKYKRWYCGHFHIYKKIDKLVFLFNDILELTT